MAAAPGEPFGEIQVGGSGPLKGLLRRYKSSSFAYAFVAAAPGEPLGGIQVGVSGPI